MKKIDITSLAFKNFARRKARSFLTILGVVIGTMAVVIMLSIGEGLKIGMEKQFEQWGSITEINVQGGYSAEGKEIILNNESVKSIQNLPNVTAVMAKKSFWGVLQKGKEISYCDIIGVDPSVIAAFDLKLKDGEMITPLSTDEIVMGYMVPFNFSNPKSKNYVWNSPTDDKGVWNPLPFNPMEEKIELTFDNSITDTGPKLPGKKPKSYKVDVVGVLEPKWDNFGSSVIMNYDTAKKWYDEYQKSISNDNNSNNGGGSSGGGSISYVGGGGMYSPGFGGDDKNKSLYDNFTVKVDDRKNVVTVQTAIKDLGFNAYSSMESLEQQEKQAKLIQLVLGGIGAIAFIVAALGITNTMMMSTYERTREIGIMKVMGCRLADIRDLFLTEACIIGFLGGVVGILCSSGVSIALNSAAGIGQMLGLGGMGGEPTKISIIPIWLIFAGVIFTTLIGLISGFYPAYRAIKLSALEAIKND